MGKGSSENEVEYRCKVGFITEYLPASKKNKYNGIKVTSCFGGVSKMYPYIDTEEGHCAAVKLLIEEFMLKGEWVGSRRFDRRGYIFVPAHSDVRVSVD